MSPSIGTHSSLSFIIFIFLKYYIFQTLSYPDKITPRILDKEHRNYNKMLCTLQGDKFQSVIKAMFLVSTFDVLMKVYFH